MVPLAACLPLWTFSVITVAGLRLNTVYVNHDTFDFTCKGSTSYSRQLANIIYKTITSNLPYGLPLRPTSELPAPVFQPCIRSSKHSLTMTPKRMKKNQVDEAATEASPNRNCTHTKRNQYVSPALGEPLKQPPPHSASTNPFQSMIEAPFAAFMRRSRLWKR